jgi:hypothetical protein
MKNIRLMVGLVALGFSTRGLAADSPGGHGGFTLEFSGGGTVRSSELQVIGAPASDQRMLAAKDGSFQVTEKIISATAPDTRREVLAITNTSAQDLFLDRVVMLDEPTPAGAYVAGSLNGSPVVTPGGFMGVEHPMADNRIMGGRLQCTLPLVAPLRPGETLAVSYVQGTVTDPSQLRRTFLAYLERERPRPYAPFLLHNTWYDIGYRNRFSEADELRIIAALGHELVEKRGVKIDSFVLDDGWDATHSLWHFNPGWPDRLKNMQAAAARVGAAPGIWLSPWGGYEQAKKERLAAAAPEGFEIRDGSFSLAGPRYYARFRELCAGVVRDGGVNFFKFDGIGGKTPGTIDPAAGRDFNAMLRLVSELRAIRPGLYVSQTTGTWASPWWLFHVDNIWRGGEDHAFAGVGPMREKWITYRDAQIYAHEVRQGPLFPLNSLMTHGIILAVNADGLDNDPGNDFENEVRSYFGGGTQLQELYLSPELLTQKNWDDIAAGAKWSRANAATLRDTHWLGGDPAKLEVYGWAAWSATKGILTLRNPSDRPASFTLDAGAAFELPVDAIRHFHVSSPFADTPSPLTELQAGTPVKIELAPFQVLILETAPVGP